MTEDYVRNATVLKVHDGDTITVEVDLGYRCQFETPLRFNRINAPELNTQEGKVAQQFLVSKIPVGSTVVVKTYKDPVDKYGRWLADVLLGDVNLNDLMVSSGNAAYYSGHGPKPSLQA